MKRSLPPSLPAETTLALQEIGAAVQRARRARGESQRAAAERINAHAQTVGRIEKGDPGVAVGSLLGLLCIYGQQDAIWKLAEDTPQTRLLSERHLPLKPRGRLKDAL